MSYGQNKSFVISPSLHQSNQSNQSDQSPIHHDITNPIHLSFIIGSRNDEYGGNPILRLRFTLQNILLYEWKSLHSVNIEIVVVEWNPVPSNPHIWEYPQIDQLLKYKTYNHNKYQFVNIKFYSIPPTYNDRINCDDTQYCPYFEYHAKNVGIRRSNGIWKMVMNIDDLWGLNLLNLIGTAIQNDLLDPNGIYQCRKKQIEIEKIQSYIDNATVIPVENILKHNLLSDPTVCLEDKNVSSAQSSLWRAAGDFILIHNSSFYDYFVGGFAELCGTDHLDSEFIMRQIVVNKLKPYYIETKCGYFHINHVKQHQARQNFTKYVTLNGAKKTINCEQSHCGGGYQNYWRRDTLSDGSLWKKVYNHTHQHWGIKGVEFDFLQF